MIAKDPQAKPFGGREPKTQSETTGQEPSLPSITIDGVTASGTARRLIQEQAMQLIGVETVLFVMEGDYGRTAKTRVRFDPTKHRGREWQAEVREYLLGPIPSTYAAHMPNSHSSGVHLVRDGKHIGGIGAKIAADTLRRCALTKLGEEMLAQINTPKTAGALVE